MHGCQQPEEKEYQASELIKRGRKKYVPEGLSGEANEGRLHVAVPRIGDTLVNRSRGGLGEPIKLLVNLIHLGLGFTVLALEVVRIVGVLAGEVQEVDKELLLVVLELGEVRDEVVLPLLKVVRLFDREGRGGVDVSAMGMIGEWRCV